MNSPKSIAVTCSALITLALSGNALSAIAAETRSQTVHFQLSKTANFAETIVGWASCPPRKYKYDFYELKLMNL